MKRYLLIVLLCFLFSNPLYASILNNNKESKFVQAEEFQSISNEASVLYAQNDIKQALEIFLTIPESQRTPQDWLLIGNLLQDQGKISEAEYMYKKALEIDNKYYKAHYNLGILYLKSDKINMAIEEFKLAIKSKPEYAYAHYNLACAYIKQEKYSKAKFELYNAIDYKNTVPEFYYNLAYVLKKLNKEKDAKIYLGHYNKLMESYVQGNNI